MSRSLFYVVCCLVIVHSSHALPIILPRDGVTEAKPESVQPKLCLLICDYWYDDPYYSPEDPPPPPHHHHSDPDPEPSPPPEPDPSSDPDPDPYWDWPYWDWPYWDDPYWDGCDLCIGISLKGTEGSDGGPAGTPKHSVAKSVTQEL
ncbi:hypothetical protein PCANC_03626 [Puccinia coronata f. sp. avenae]|uniref:Uncharacterized protein n=1 Tax=Puccinia coronata f. sp. avenae TaxID=200324 RepID=A0A2N5SXR2_9BASI|nr:hypothetical protein PCANC_07172 [Puccinia coronata f. sp. avenae]PLW23315.1 hypothetical protein PCASD_10976 [Puccinia coronata f. sp. avenae]PLW53770.1 hypothetical protein PCANC_03626 [Puccinia coronata f. sp. avenae]